MGVYHPSIRGRMSRDVLERHAWMRERFLVSIKIVNGDWNILNQRNATLISGMVKIFQGHADSNPSHRRWQLVIIARESIPILCRDGGSLKGVLMSG